MYKTPFILKFTREGPLTYLHCRVQWGLKKWLGFGFYTDDAVEFENELKTKLEQMKPRRNCSNITNVVNKVIFSHGFREEEYQRRERAKKLTAV